MKLNRTALRTIKILEYIANQKDGCTLLEITEALDIPKSSAFDIVKTLLYKKMIVEDQNHGKLKYKMGINAFIIGSGNIERLDLVEAAKNQLIETANHFKLVDYMLDIADKNLTEDIIKKFHKILKEGTMDSRKEWFNVGDYKKLANEAGNMKTSSPKQAPKDMQKLMEWYNSLAKVTIKEIIEFHARFEKIHPFQDENGRVGRIIAFKECLKNNIIPFIILDKDKLYYYRGLKEYQNKTEKGYLIDTCLNAQDEYTKMIEYYLK